MCNNYKLGNHVTDPLTPSLSHIIMRFPQFAIESEFLLGSLLIALSKL